MIIKKLLYKTLSLDNYLRVLSRLYFLSLDMGVLRWKRAFDYPYFLPELITPGDTVIDIGANLGYYSVPVARLLKGEGHLYPVEPVDRMRRVLEKNIRKFGNVTVLPYALGAQEKEITMGNDSVNERGYLATGVNMVLDDNTGANNAAMEFSVEMRRGSLLFGDLPHIDFIKCDIEGYEGVVIPEMMPLIEKHKPLILLESGGDIRSKMVSLLKKAGYMPFVLRKHHLYPLRSGDAQDILFIPADRAEKKAGKPEKFIKR